MTDKTPYDRAQIAEIGASAALDPVSALADAIETIVSICRMHDAKVREIFGAQIADLGSDPTPYDRRSPMEHERDAGVTPLRKLIEAVEAGKATMNNFAAALPSETAYGKTTWGTAHNAFTGSLDAAKALHEAMLGCDWTIESFGLNGEVVLMRSRPIDRQYGFADMDPARAWLIAILRAYEARQ